MTTYVVTLLNSPYDSTQFSSTLTKIDQHTIHIDADHVVLDRGMWSFYDSFSVLLFAFPVSIGFIEPVGIQIPNFSYYTISTYSLYSSFSGSSDSVDINIKSEFSRTIINGKVQTIYRKETIYCDNVQYQDDIYFFFSSGILLYAISGHLISIDPNSVNFNFSYYSSISSGGGGFQGWQGDIGPQGIEGSGPQGWQGPPGAGGTGGSGSGFQGFQGFQGEKGFQGPQGSNINYFNIDGGTPTTVFPIGTFIVDFGGVT